MDARREPVDIRETHREDLDSTLLHEIDKVWDRIESEAPVGTHAQRGLFGFGRVAQHGPGGFARHVPIHGGQPQDLFDGEISLQQVQDPGLDLRLLAAAREPFFPEIDGFETNVAVAGQVVDRHIEGVCQRDEHSGAGHGLVAFVLADRLRRYSVVDSGIPSRGATGHRRAGIP